MSTGFATLGIRSSLVQKLQALGVSEPTPIQQQAIPALLSGADVIAQAQTGTGKTLAFVLPMLELINTEKPEVQGLILTPTRELAIQISSELQKLAPVTGANVLAAYGGQDVERQLRKLEGHIHIVVGTPGRLLDHLRRGSVQFYKLNMLVLDEADQMLHMGFLNEVEEIIAQTSSRRQTLLFSATMPQQVRQLSKRYLREPLEIEIKSKQVTLTEIDQVLIQTTDRAKQNALVAELEKHKPYLAMIFCRTKRRASALNEALQELGYASDELHGDLSQAKREQVMKRFREGKIIYLIATDIAARGLDVEGVTHVFNYDIPHDAESYIHRIGRTGRAGQTGVAVTFAAPRDMFYVELIEKGIRMPLRNEDQPRRVRAEGDATSGRGSARKGAGDARRGSARASAARPARGGATQDGERGRGRADSAAARPARGGAAQAGERGRGRADFAAARPARGGAAQDGERGRGRADFAAARPARGGATQAGERGRGRADSAAARPARGGATQDSERGRGRADSAAARPARGGAARANDRGRGRGKR